MLQIEDEKQYQRQRNGNKKDNYFFLHLLKFRSSLSHLRIAEMEQKMKDR